MQKGTLVAEKSDKFSIWWDEDRGSVWIDVFGFWTTNEMVAFLPPADAALTKSRAHHGGGAFLLFDTTESQVWTGALIEGFHSSGSRLIKPTDRVAVVFASNLLKLQMKRLRTTKTNADFFVSRSAADTWLHAHLPADA